MTRQLARAWRGHDAAIACAMGFVISKGFIAFFGTVLVLAFGTVLALTGVEGHIVGYLGLLGVLIPPRGGVLISDSIAPRRDGQPALETLTEKLRWQALVP